MRLYSDGSDIEAASAVVITSAGALLAALVFARWYLAAKAIKSTAMRVAKDDTLRKTGPSPEGNPAEMYVLIAAERCDGEARQDENIPTLSASHGYHRASFLSCGTCHGGRRWIRGTGVVLQPLRPSPRAGRSPLS